jgi:hypothetical protein
MGAAIVAQHSRPNRTVWFSPGHTPHGRGRRQPASETARHGTAGAISPPTGNGYPFAAPEATPPLPSPATPQPRRGGIQANHPLHHAVPSSLSPCVQIPRSIELSPGGGGIPFGHRFAFSTGADPSIDRSISASRNQSVADSVRPGRRRTVN